MEDYNTVIVEPTLNETEYLLYQVLRNLWVAQINHRVHDPFPPPRPPPVDSPEDVVDQWRKEFVEHRLTNPAPEILPPLSLTDLWPHIDPPPSLRPRQASGDDMYFDHFAISQRFVPNEKRSPLGSWPRHYWVAIPTGDSHFRCIAHESSGRLFYTLQRHADCTVPGPNEFAVLRVTHKAAVESQSHRRAATVMHLYLPSRYGRWAMIRHDPSYYDENVVGDDGN